MTGKQFGELIHHFIVGIDETCFMACMKGTLNVFASASKNKHENKDINSRASITLYRTVNFNVDIGPTVFVMGGVRSLQGFNDKFLRRHGRAVGSTFLIPPTAYMEKESWEAITPSICKRLLTINNSVKVNQDW